MAVLTAMTPLHDGDRLWLVPGDWTRGQAMAYAAREVGDDFIRFRACRAYFRWAHLNLEAVGWRFEDGTLTPCAASDQGAEPYWEVVWHG
jgi:hypothetical protein